MLSLVNSEVRKEKADFPEDLAKMNVRGDLLGVNRFNYQLGVSENINLLDVQLSCLD